MKHMLKSLETVIYLCFFLCSPLFCRASQPYYSDNGFLPVIYVIYGPIPTFLLLNIELASRHNDVIVLSDTPVPKIHQGFGNGPDGDVSNNVKYRVTFEDLHLYTVDSDDFGLIYKHLSKDGSIRRMQHELRCFQRWYIQTDIMVQNQISRAFFGDGDSSVFMSIKKAIKHREHCSAILSIDAQGNNLYWVAAGEASVWSVAAIIDFYSFTTKMYKTKMHVLHIKSSRGSSVVDMSLLWLWWVSRQSIASAGWNAGRPYNGDRANMTAEELEEYRRKSDDSVLFSKKLPLPEYDEMAVLSALASAPKLMDRLPATTSIELCNGMDVVNRTVFDHMTGWKAGKNHNLNILGDDKNNGYPYTVAAALVEGGKSEIVPPNDLNELEEAKLYFVNFHYQGNTKKFIAYDVCRLLLFSGTRHISNKVVSEKCLEEIKKKDPLNENKCHEHEEFTPGVQICF